MNKTCFIIFAFACFSTFAQTTDIILLDFENTESNDFDKDFYLNVQEPLLVDMINGCDDIILLLAEKDILHIQTTRAEVFELIENLTNPAAGYQSITNVPYWDDQLENIITSKILREKISDSIQNQSVINFHFITNDSSEETKNRIIDFYKELGLLFDFYNSSGFIDELSSRLYVSFGKNSQKILNLHD
jgi:hypothetical protein